MALVHSIYQPLQFVVIDPSPNSRKLLEALFHVYGIETFSFATASEALAWFTCHQIIPDLLISEMRLPGEEISSLIQSQHLSQGQVPMLALTVCARDSDRVRALTLGFDLHIAKPVSIHRLMHSIVHLLDRPQIIASELKSA